MGRPRIIGERLPTLLERLADPTTPWQRFHVSGLVRRRRAPGRDHLRHGDLVSSGQARPDPLCSGARCRRRVQASGVPVHGPAGRSARYPALVCPPLGHGGDLCRGAQAPGCGDTTPVVGQGHCADDAGSARLVLARDPLDQRPWCSPAGAAPWRCLVPETGPHLQRRSCGGAPVPVGGRTFQHVTSDRRHHESGNCRSRPLDCYTVLPSLNGQTRAQEGRFFHGYYDCYGYLPLYIFCGRHLLAAKLRRSNIDASAGAVEEVQRIVHQIRARWPRVTIVLRADSAFAREALMLWCEQNRVDFVFGLARNTRLETRVAAALQEAQTLAAATSQPARVFRDFLWSTKETWSRRRRVIAKAEWTRGEANPRFLVTSLKPDRWAARALYEVLYCARGEMENRIKETQGDLFADRTSAASMRANQLRLWFASMAYVLLCALRRIGLSHTALAAATCGTIRLKLLKIGALVRISARRVKVAMASACPAASEWRLAHARLIIAARAPPA